MKTILVIEDNLEIRENVSELLELKGYNVVVANNGREGLEAAIKCQPDLIVCDILMPELNGHEVLIRLKKSGETSTIPLIFLTASVEKREIKQGLELGAAAYIRKPFEDDDLMGEIERCLDYCN
jgi:CheY-like chemotaxis protein